MTTTSTTVMTAKVSFDRFGDDLCQLLLQYLPIDDKLRLESVSKQWQSLIFNTQTDLEFDWKLVKNLSLDSLTDKQISGLFEYIIKNCPNITTLTIRDIYFWEILFDLLIKYCLQLRHIYLIPNTTNIQWQIIEDKFDRFCRQFGQQLMTFKFHNYCKSNEQFFYKCIDCLPNLKTLDIKYCGISDIQFTDIFTANKSYVLPKSLQSMSLTLNNFTATLFAKFADTYGQQLTSLDIFINSTNYYIDIYESLITGFSQMKQLRQLTIKFRRFYIDKLLLATIGRNCRQLKAFYLSYDYFKMDIIGLIIKTINKHMSPQLKRLSLKSYHSYDNSDLKLTSGSLNRLNGLTHLTLWFNDFSIIGDQFFCDIHLNHPRLQYIKCSKVSITDESIAALGQLAHLTDVYLWLNNLMKNESYNKQHLLIGTKVKNLSIKYMNSFDKHVFSCGKYFDGHN
ncbi:uncharacterized protein LOC128954394 [Oppia nitens]|uniref:uncharacterized protein LOC128954394 n=1 Tax=Oppia nitens TaxID=1686743 RepID=UPI0023DACD12|nr:uncharacterized protein LOC128954394 [Oppia nitens]